jgi:hypothetical protein
MLHRRTSAAEGRRWTTTDAFGVAQGWKHGDEQMKKTALTQIRFEEWLANGRPSLVRLGGNRWLKFRETADGGFEYMYRVGCWRTFKPGQHEPRKGEMRT